MDRGVYPYLEYNKTYRMKRPGGGYTLYHLKKLEGDRASLLNLNNQKLETHSKKALERLLSMGEMYISAHVHSSYYGNEKLKSQLLHDLYKRKTRSAKKSEIMDWGLQAGYTKADIERSIRELKFAGNLSEEKEILKLENY